MHRACFLKARYKSLNAHNSPLFKQFAFLTAFITRAFRRTAKSAYLLGSFSQGLKQLLFSANERKRKTPKECLNKARLIRAPRTLRDDSR